MLTTLQLSKPLIIMLILCSAYLNIFANDDFDQRAQDLIHNAINNDNGLSLLIAQAYLGETLDDTILTKELKGLPCKATADFTITSLIRILNFTDGEYDDQILSVLEELPFWLESGETSRQYWSENHMLMWMSANYLLLEKYGWEARPTLRQNLVHWLKLKIEYGYYEYFSSVYLPFTSAGLLNLVDFVEDEEIKSLATQAVSRLYKDVLLIVNDKGAYYPTAGRNEISRYTSYYRSSIQSVIYLLSGLGSAPNGFGRGSGALATSTIEIDDVVNSYEQSLNTTLDYGHPLSIAREIHADLSFEDRVIFQWSAGGYFHPLVANQTLSQLKRFDLWQHEEFSPFSFAKYLPTAIGTTFANVAASITRSSYIGSAEIDVFKNNGVVLTSSHDKWKGRLGYQIYPVVATVEETCVFTRSGEIKGWDQVPSRTSNEHLPYVSQEENVALVMYRPNIDLEIFGYDNQDVALFWVDSTYEEVRTFDNWILGRIGDSYVAVKKHCNEEVEKVVEICTTIIEGQAECGEEVNEDSITETTICETRIIKDQACGDKDGQTWAIVVGNIDIHGSFDGFENIIREAEYEERWYFDWQKFEWVYYGKINVDGQLIDYHWRGNVLSGPKDQGLFGRESDGLHALNTDVKIYPNPANENIMIDLSAYEVMVQSVEVIDIKGQVIYHQELKENDPLINIDCSNWAEGIYSILLNNGKSIDHEQVIINR